MRSISFMYIELFFFCFNSYFFHLHHISTNIIFFLNSLKFNHWLLFTFGHSRIFFDDKDKILSNYSVNAHIKLIFLQFLFRSITQYSRSSCTSTLVPKELLSLLTDKVCTENDLTFDYEKEKHIYVFVHTFVHQQIKTYFHNIMK